MSAIDTLEQEHQWIGWMAEVLESMVVRAQVEGSLPEAAYDLLSLYETFADGRHQEKEEQVLFPALLGLAGERDREVLARLLTDHRAERRYMNGMRSSVLGAVHGESMSVRRFVHEASAYLELHRAHVLRENEILLPRARRLLTPGTEESVQRGFETIEGGAGDPHGIREQILSLRQRVGLPRPPAA